MNLEFNNIIGDVILSIIYVLISFILGNVLSKKLYEVFTGILNLRIIKNHIKEEKFIVKIIEFITVFTKYMIYFMGIILGLNQLKIEIINKILYNLIDYIPNIIIATIFVILGIMLSNLTRRIIKISLSSSGIDELFSELDQRFLPSNLFGVVGQYTILIISLVVALSQLGLQTQLLSWIALSITTIITFFMFLFAYSASKPFLPDLLAGVIIRNKRYFRIGEYIKLNNEKYRVLGIGIFHTKLERNKNFKIMKNSEVLKNFERKME